MPVIPLNSPFSQNAIIGGKWSIRTLRLRSSDMDEVEEIFVRADNYTSVLQYVERLRKNLFPVSIELVGVYYYDLFFDLANQDKELPFDLSVFLYCLF